MVKGYTKLLMKRNAPPTLNIIAIEGIIRFPT